MRFLTLLLLMTFSGSLYAQKISGFVKDDNGNAAVGAVIALLKSSDSSVVKWAIASETGLYVFSDIKEGIYTIAATQIGFTPVFSNRIIMNHADTTLADLVLNKLVSKLKEVTVTAQKPLIEVKADKTIINVDATINAVGTDALELLRKSPGVIIDKDDKISMNGKNGVQVYIDGRPSHLSGDDLSHYLKSMQSSQVESVHLISNPSARYDAAGNAGIINIILKKNKALGTNGSINGGWNIGTYPKYNAGIVLNHRNKKVNLFGNYAYSDGKNFSGMNIYRTVADTLFDQHGTGTYKYAAHNFKAGIDYFPNKTSTIGAMVTGSFSDGSYMSYSRTPIIYMPEKNVNRIQIANNNLERKSESMSMNFNYTHTSPKGKTLSVNSDYGFHHLRSNQLQPNDYYDALGVNKLNSIVTRMITPANINIYSLKADYEQTIKKDKLETGAKTAYVNTVNDLQQYDVYGGTSTLDKDRSNRFDYKENINAVYANYSRPFKGFMIQAGIRVENTNLQGSLNAQKKAGTEYVAYDSVFTRSFTDLFPSAAVSFNKNPANQLSLTYSRRIDRPSYKDLNPFELKRDAYTSTRGNINLRPQYTNSFGITHSYKYKLTTSVDFSIVKDMFTLLFDTTEKSKLAITNRNLATQKIINVSVSYVVNHKTYSGILNITSDYSTYKANIEGRLINLNAMSFTAYAQNSYTFGKTFTAQLTGMYIAPTLYMGAYKANAIWSIDAGLQKKILNGKATIKTSVSDLFRTLRFSGTTDFAGQKTVSSSRFESRQFKLSFAYRFGNNQVKAARQRSTGAEDENKRVQQRGNGLGIN